MVRQATWCSEDAAWTVKAERQETGETVRIRCNFLLICAGYYSYESGYTPEFKGRQRFTGEIIHPQDWPEDLDYLGKEIVVIGSGATAVTLAPALAEKAGHVVMLQRSPSYIAARPAEDKIANLLRRVLPEKIAYALTRWKNILFQQYVYRQTRTNPEKVKEKLLEMVRDELGPDYDVERHFTPSYDPWDQRLCLTPDGDLFAAIRSGQVSVVTDHIETFIENGICLESGETLTADIIVTATGLELRLLGGVDFLVDGRSIDFAQTYTYKGMMYSGVPNLASIFGYVNASWTLRADLMAEYLCRLLNHMDVNGYCQCTPRLRDTDQEMPVRPWFEAFTPNYIRRKLHLLPKQGDRTPWLNVQDYGREKKIFRRGAIEDGVLQFKPCDSAQRESEQMVSQPRSK